MVSKVFPEGHLIDDTLEFARRIAALPSAVSLMIKEAVNQTQDNQGFHNALNAAFTIHELNHAHWAMVSHGKAWVQTEETGAVGWKDSPPIRVAQKSAPRLVALWVAREPE
jgi:enoyl-CoA hydratase